jgi:hypothetical protein
VTRTRWLYPWGVSSVAAGGASLLVPLHVVALGGGPGTPGVLAGVAGGVGSLGGGWLVEGLGVTHQALSERLRRGTNALVRDTLLIGDLPGLTDIS